MVEIDLAREPSEEQKKRQEALALFQNGVSLAQADKLEEALDAFRKAVELKPDFAEAHINLGLLLYRQGKADEAEKALLKALELKPEESKTKEALADIYFEKAKELLQLEKIDEALEKLKLSSGFNPNYPFTNYLLGYAYTQKGMKEEAIKSFEAFLQLEPNAPQAAKVKEILETLKK
jgi:tetratricopeptide (TPR) repeat protein